MNMENNKESLLGGIENDIRNQDSLISLFFKTVIRMMIFSFLLLSAAAVFYVVGNFQKFLDSTELSLLKLSIVISICLLVFSAITVLITILESIILKKFQKKIIFVFLFAVVSIVAGLICSIYARSVIILAQGY